MEDQYSYENEDEIRPEYINRIIYYSNIPEKIIEDSNKVLKCSFDSDFFENDKKTAIKFKIALQVMKEYERDSQYVIKKLDKDYGLLPQKYIDKLPFNYHDKINKVKEGFKLNQIFFNKITSLYSPKFDYINLSPNFYEDRKYSDIYLLHGFFIDCLIRDWSIEGKEERELSYGKIINELKKYFDYDNKNIIENGVKILLPGTGCSRMAYELSKLGYKVEANELSYIYIMTCDYLFNYAKKNEIEFIPRIKTFSSSFTEESVLRKHYIPDVDIKNDLLNIKNLDLKLIKGDFVKQYKDKKEIFDCVITLYFIDYAKNILEFVEIIYNILKKGGVWINMGCLDYGYPRNGMSIELTWDELRKVILNYGFIIENESIGFIPYGKIEGHSLPNEYGTITFSAVKK